MEDFYTLRTDFYVRRKTALLNRMQSEWSKLDNKVRFLIGRLMDLDFRIQSEGILLGRRPPPTFTAVQKKQKKLPVDDGVR